MMNKVLYNIDQRNDTTDAQKTTARANIGAASVSDLTAESTARDEADTLLGNAISAEESRAKAAEVGYAEYDRANTRIVFKTSQSATTSLFDLDASQFIVGGIIDSIYISDGNLVISYTDSEGQSASVSIPVSDIFDADNYYNKDDVDGLLGGKVDTVTGKGLSTNDFTSILKTKLDGIASGAQVNVIETVKVNGTAQTVTSKAVDISVPTKISQLTNDSGFITASDVPQEVEYVDSSNTFADVKAIVDAGHLPVYVVNTIPTGPSGYYRDRYVMSSYHYSESQGRSASFSRTAGNTVTTYTIDGSTNQWTTTTTTIPAAQVNSDWNATTGVAAISNKPTFANENDTTTAIDATTPIVVGYNSVSKKLKTRLVSALMSFLGISVSNNAKSFSGTADTADKVNYDTITSGNAYIPALDHNGKRLKVVAGSQGLIMQKASDSDYALINCKSALAAEADHANNANYSAWAVGIGSPNGHPAVGEDGRPVYINSNGIPTPCTYKQVVGELGSSANTLYFF